MENKTTYHLHFTFLLIYITAEEHFCYCACMSTIKLHSCLPDKQSSNPIIRQIKVQTMNGRVYDPTTASFLSPDNYVQMPDYSLGFNRYAYAMNNPLVYTDPSGDVIFSILAAVFCPPLLPVAIGADIGWMTGGTRAISQGETFWYGAWRGALVGAVGGGLSMGGAGMSFAANLALGTAEGALTGGLDAVLWGNDIGERMLWGAASGAVFTTLTSENFSNWTKGKGFYTNENIFNNFKAGKYSIPKGSTWQQESLDYFGFEGTYNPNHPLLKGNGYLGVTDPKTGNIFYNNKAFDEYYKLKFIVDHESKHNLNILSGKFKNIKLTSV